MIYSTMYMKFFDRKERGQQYSVFALPDEIGATVRYVRSRKKEEKRDRQILGIGYTDRVVITFCMGSFVLICLPGMFAVQRKDCQAENNCQRNKGNLRMCRGG